MTTKTKQKNTLIKTVLLFSLLTAINATEISYQIDSYGIYTPSTRSTSVPPSTSSTKSVPFTVSYNGTLSEIESKTTKQDVRITAHDINRLSVKRAAQILSYEPILVKSGQIWKHLNAKKAELIWNKIQQQDETSSKEQWDSSLLITPTDWNTATVKHFRHWIKYNSTEISKHVNSTNINTFLKALIGSGIENLNLAYKNLSSIPSLINQITGLNHLDLSYNSITTIKTNTFNQLTELKVLVLGANLITTLEKNAFSGLTKLETLYLLYNQLSILTKNRFNKLVGLKNLDLSFNRITTLAANIFNGLAKLNNLKLVGNKLTIIAAKTFINLTELRSLDLSDNSITTLAKNAFSGLTSLEQLNLTYNKLTTLDTDLFIKIKTLETLRLSYNKFTVILIPTSNLKSLEILELYCCFDKSLLELATIVTKLKVNLGKAFTNARILGIDDSSIIY